MFRHFGLADEYYTHFTSPIRRYPDLLGHRLIRTFLFKQDYKQTVHFEEVIPELAEQSSYREKEAVDIEREVTDMKMAEYMSEHIGEEFEGMISSITSFGFFVELPNTIDGLVHITDLTDDYYHYDEKQMVLVGERTGRIFKLSDKVKVRVVACDKKKEQLILKLWEWNQEKRNQKL